MNARTVLGAGLAMLLFIVGLIAMNPETARAATTGIVYDRPPADADFTPIVMKFGTSSADITLTAQAFMDWAKRLDEYSGGKVKIDVFCSSVLGNNTEMVQGAQMGIIDIVVIQPGGIADMGAKKMNLYCLPYLFSDYQQYVKTLFGDIGGELLQDVTDNVQGLIGFSYLPDGGRCYFTGQKPIRNIDDIRNMKLRIQPYAIDVSTSRAIGFSSTPVAFSELYSALQTGVVDGAENPISGIDGNALYEVSKYLVLDNHTYNIPILIVSAATWRKITDDTKALMKFTWNEMVNEFYLPQLESSEAELLDKFRKHGVEIIPALEDRGKWVEAVQPIWKEYGVGLEDLIAGVKALGDGKGEAKQ